MSGIHARLEFESGENDREVTPGMFLTVSVAGEAAQRQELERFRQLPRSPDSFLVMAATAVLVVPVR